jgi:hypothetical protein
LIADFDSGGDFTSNGALWSVVGATSVLLLCMKMKAATSGVLCSELE